MKMNSWEKLRKKLSWRQGQAKNIQVPAEVAGPRGKTTGTIQVSEPLYATLFEKSADAMLLIEGQRFVDCNQATLDMLGYDCKTQVFNLHPSVLSPEYQDDGRLSSEKADEMIAIAFERGSHRFEWLHKRRNGEVFPVEVLLTVITDGKSQLLHVVWRDISKRKANEAEIKFRAYYDSITELPNRLFLLERLQDSMGRNRRRHHFHALLFMDIDRFKIINDTLGHGLGDKVLIEVANRLRRNIRKDDVAARFGGDEFVVFLPDLSYDERIAHEHAKALAEKLQQQFLEPLKLEDQQLYVTLSIGINVFPSNEIDTEKIIKHADTAMYSAKEAGRNRTSTYLTQMHEKILRRLTLEKDLRAALAAKEIMVYYQPQVDRDFNIVGFEALVRWQHDELGFIPPDEFISIAEETGLIYPLGKFVLQQAIENLLELEKNQGLTLSVSVNISPRELQSPDWVNSVGQCLERYALRQGFLTLETTEGIMIDNFNDTCKKLRQLQSLGILNSLDDFGTGYSSLSYLKRLPLDELKIDKSFIADIVTDKDDAKLVQVIIDIAHQFGMKTVAEGVENQEQVDLLMQAGCDYFQGYFFAKPQPFSELNMLFS